MADDAATTLSNILRNFDERASVDEETRSVMTDDSLDFDDNTLSATDAICSPELRAAKVKFDRVRGAIREKTAALDALRPSEYSLPRDKAEILRIMSDMKRDVEEWSREAADAAEAAASVPVSSRVSSKHRDGRAKMFEQRMLSRMNVDPVGEVFFSKVCMTCSRTFGEASLASLWRNHIVTCFGACTMQWQTSKRARAWIRLGFLEVTDERQRLVRLFSNTSRVQASRLASGNRDAVSMLLPAVTLQDYSEASDVSSRGVMKARSKSASVLPGYHPSNGAQHASRRMRGQGSFSARAAAHRRRLSRGSNDGQSVPDVACKSMDKSSSASASASTEDV